ncbi:prolipoprotein diacylglyceryl transferase [Chlorogloeopsis sp. ULAP01]|uniref:prolipoprotein diacylglyceryl transferase n=1 Tax=Chlorogloeopsis sp. ULAP01 TaxID=3056483 RepID=UPI0025AAA0B5|nr:prolipoprotein diacylglyceryl transferase family protein [Chlorogloeopsis sp. ULAP01]MDM9381982.1 prolipoprotein diacylglyceryl transferase [Chlorogloeopsis sp. ULAP01]
MTFPVYFYLGSLRIHPHILFESLAYIVGLHLILRNVRNDFITPAQRTLIIVGGLLGALVGAKVLVLLQHLDLLWQNSQFFLLLSLQGKTIVGALLGAVIGVEITKKIIGINRSTGDVFVYPLIIGTAIGRIGCFLTGLSDRTYGIATTLPWGVDFGDGILRHPTQLYEIIFLIFLLIFIRLRSNYKYKEGDLFKFYLILYLIFRFLIDLIKPDFRIFLGMSAIQIACLCAIVYYWHTIPQILRLKA